MKEEIRMKVPKKILKKYHKFPVNIGDVIYTHHKHNKQLEYTFIFLVLVVFIISLFDIMFGLFMYSYLLIVFLNLDCANDMKYYNSRIILELRKKEGRKR